MPKPLKIAGAAIGGLVLLLAAGVAILAANFDPNDYKSLAAERVKAATGRTLAIPGRVSLSVFPRLGVQTGEVTLSEPGSDKPFASLKSARVGLQLMPLLLRRQVAAERVELAGLQAEVVRFADGRTSIDDLIKPAPAPAAAGAPEPAASAAPLQIDAEGIAITDATLVFDDRQAGRRVALERADIQVGRITPGQPGELSFKGHVTSSAPVVKADVTLAGRFLLRPAEGRYSFERTQASASGQLADGTLDLKLNIAALDLGADTIRIQQTSAQATLKTGPRTLALNLTLPDFSGKPPAFKLPSLGAEFSITDGPLNAKARVTGEVDGNTETLAFASPQSRVVFEGRQGDTALKGSIAAPWTVDLKQHLATLPRIAAELVLPNSKGGTMTLAAQGKASVRLDTGRADAALAGTLDESRFDAKFGWLAPGIRFDVSIDRLDADRYRKAAAAAPKDNAPAADPPLDFSALRTLNAQGSLKLGALQAAGLKAGNLRVDLKAANGRVELAPLSADLYQGRTSGSLLLQATGTPRVTVKQDLQQVALGPLLKDLLQRDSLEGRGDVALDVSGEGATVGALLKSLNGNARLALKDGAVRGFNIAQALRDAKAKLRGDGGSGTGNRGQTTDFSELGGSFRIERGVAHTEDLAAKSPLLRVGAAGDVNIGESRLDMLVRATVVTTLQGQGGPELQALRGQTVPVRLSGPFTAIGWKIDLAAMAEEAAKAKVDEKAAVVKEKAKEKLGEKLKGLLGR